MADATHIDVSYVANLAQIQLTEEEAGLFQSQLNQVLTYVEQLNEPDISGVEPTAHAMPLVNVLREDVPAASFDHDAAIANAPASRDGQILVPKINDQF
ncbi:MAG: Asp-tRNA(Asn)/Glu-tRNA(Gln) amidotransferase subunit GatC [Kiritimatiellales bacterium]